MELLKTYARADLIHPALYELMAYDEKNHAELTDTLEAYLLCRHNYVKTAERLCIHRNTLLYRLKRIGELTGLDLEKEDAELHLLLSFRILKQKRE